MPTFRVFAVMPTTERAASVCQRAADLDITHDRLFACDFGSAVSSPGGAIFRTPRRNEPAYSFFG